MKDNTFIELKIRVSGEAGSQNTQVHLDWSPVGRVKMKAFIIHLCTGKYLDNILSAIEDHNSQEAVEIVGEIEEYYTGALNNLMNQFQPPPKHENSDDSEDILPSNAFGGGQL